VDFTLIGRHLDPLEVSPRNLPGQTKSPDRFNRFFTNNFPGSRPTNRFISKSGSATETAEDARLRQQMASGRAAAQGEWGFFERLCFKFLVLEVSHDDILAQKSHPNAAFLPHGFGSAAFSSGSFPPSIC